MASKTAAANKKSLQIVLATRAAVVARVLLSPSSTFLLRFFFRRFSTLLVCNTFNFQNNCMHGRSHNVLHMSKVLQERAISFTPKFALQVARKDCL